MSSDESIPLHRRRKSSVALDIDDEDREFFYKRHGRPTSSAGMPFRRSRVLIWSVIGTLFFLLVLLLPGSKRKEKAVDWSRYAYSLYATDVQTLCNAHMVFEALHRYGSKAERLIHYPIQWDTVVHSDVDRSSELLVEMQRKYGVKLIPVDLIGADGPVWPGTLSSEASWDASITKLIAFQLTTFERVLHLDGDITLLQHLDELFLLPKTPVAMPRAYWADVPPPTWEGGRAYPLTSMLVLLQPNQKEFKYMMDTLHSWRMSPEFDTHKKYDMDLLNHRFGSSAMVLPHRPYALLSSEFRREDHSTYLGQPHSVAKWDAVAVLKEAKLVHFSDWPLPKPWVMWPTEGVVEMQPKCSGVEDCEERKIWKSLYDDFRRRRKDICKILSVPAPQWDKWKAEHGYGNSTAGSL